MQWSSIRSHALAFTLAGLSVASAGVSRAETGPNRGSGVLEVALLESSASASAGEVAASIADAQLGSVLRVLPLAMRAGWLVRLSTTIEGAELLEQLAVLELGFPSLIEPLDLPGGRGALRPSVLVSANKGYDDEAVRSLLGGFGGVLAERHAGVEGLWLLETRAETGHEVSTVVATLELLPELEWVQPRPFAVLPTRWPQDWFYLDDGAPVMLDMARDSLTIHRSSLSHEELEAALDDLGLGSFPRNLSFGGGFYFVCTPTTQGRPFPGLRRVFAGILAAQIGFPSPAFHSGHNRLVLGPELFARFHDPVALRRRLELAESVGDIVRTTTSGVYRIEPFARTGIDLLASANALAQLEELRWAQPDPGLVGPGPGDPGSPPVTPCDPSTFP